MALRVGGIGALKEFGVKLQNQPPQPYSRRSNILRANVIRNAASPAALMIKWQQ